MSYYRHPLPEPDLSVADVATVLSLDETTIYSLVQSGELEAYRVGRGPKARIRVTRESLARFRMPTKPASAAAPARTKPTKATSSHRTAMDTLKRLGIG